ncbi:hypothetical protein M413DRAFT_438097, partial [Hebeloma cylindrosporum]
MSNTAGDQSDFDFWEFVSCSKCRMPFALDNGLATVPFWLTECGHVICNNHLSLSFIISLYRFVTRWCIGHCQILTRVAVNAGRKASK